MRLLKSIGLIEITSLFTLENLPNTFITGRFQINAVWLTPNLGPYASSIAPFFFGIRDHKVFIVDFQLESILKDEFVLITKSDMRPLISS